jgi:hypothetical protein
VISAAWHWLDPALAVPEFNALARESREADRPEGPHEGDPAERRRRRRVEFPPGSPLSPPEEPQERAEFSERVRSFLDRQPWDEVDVPMICRCLRSTRLPG